VRWSDAYQASSNLSRVSTAQRRRLVLGVVALLVLVGASAIAHEKKSRAETTIDGPSEHHFDDKCVLTEGSVADGNYGHGFTRSKTYAVQFMHQESCGAPDYQSAGQIGSRYAYLFRKRRNAPGPSRWMICRSTGWRYNQQDHVYWFSLYKDRTVAPCGGGRYATRARGKVHFYGRWHENGVTSGNHFFN
jgi:hypothetical protein